MDNEPSPYYSPPLRTVDPSCKIPLFVESPFTLAHLLNKIFRNKAKAISAKLLELNLKKKQE